MKFTAEQHRLMLETMQPVPRMLRIPELPEVFFQPTNDIEQVLREQRLPYALDEFVRSQHARTARLA
jgi:hypothetical protein